MSVQNSMYCCQVSGPYLAMVRVAVRAELRVCTTSRIKGHNHLKRGTVESTRESSNQQQVTLPTLPFPHAVYTVQTQPSSLVWSCSRRDQLADRVHSTFNQLKYNAKSLKR